MRTGKFQIKRQLIAYAFAIFYLFLVSGRLAASPAESDEAAHFRAKMQVRVLERIASFRDDGSDIRVWFPAIAHVSMQWADILNWVAPTPIILSLSRFPFQFEININGP